MREHEQDGTVQAVSHLGMVTRALDGWVSVCWVHGTVCVPEPTPDAAIEAMTLLCEAVE